MKKLHTPLWWDETTNFKEGFIFCEQLAAHICSFWIGGPSEAWNEMIQYWVQVKMKRVKIVLTFFPTVRSWGPCRGRGLPIGWGLRCLVLVATGAILWVALEGMDEKDCPRCNPNFSHVNLPPKLPTRGTRRKMSTLRLFEVKPDFLTEEAELWGPSWSGLPPPSSTRLPLWSSTAQQCYTQWRRDNFPEAHFFLTNSSSLKLRKALVWGLQNSW